MSIEFREDSLLEKRILEQEIYVASRDYQVTKAARLKKEVDILYPGHTTWYNEEIGILRALENQLEETNPEAWQRVLLRRNAGRPLEE